MQRACCGHLDFAATTSKQRDGEDEELMFKISEEEEEEADDDDSEDESYGEDTVADRRLQVYLPMRRTAQRRCHRATRHHLLYLRCSKNN